MQELLSGVLLASWFLLGVMLVFVIFFVTFSSRYHSRHKHLHPRKLVHTPFISIIVPSYNESKTLANCIHSLVNQTYENYEIIIVNDGSTDTTRLIAGRLAKKHRPLIRVINKRNGGKASALNRGVARAKGDIIICIDADSMFLENTVEQLVLSFHNPDVAAVGGNVKVANRKSFLSKQQSLEYITGLTLQRKAFAQVGCMQVISGAIGAFRKEALLAIGGYSTSTIVEDMDLTIELGRRGYKVIYNPWAIAYTEAPESLDAFLKQRFRWTYGSFQVIAKHRDVLWARGTNRMGFIGMPYFLVVPWLQVLTSMVFITSLVGVMLTEGGDEFLTIILFTSALQTSLIAYALIMDKEEKKLIVRALVDCFVYYHLISFTTLRAGIHFMRKKQTGWNKLERYGKNVVPLGNMLPVAADDSPSAPDPS